MHSSDEMFQIIIVEMTNKTKSNLYKPSDFFNLPILYSYFFSSGMQSFYFTMKNSVLDSIVLSKSLIVKLLLFFLSISSSICLGAQKNPLLEMVLLSTNNTCFG